MKLSVVPEAPPPTYTIPEGLNLYLVLEGTRFIALCLEHKTAAWIACDKPNYTIVKVAEDTSK